MSDVERIVRITDAVHGALHDCDEIEDWSLRVRCMHHLKMCLDCLDGVIDSARRMG